MFRVRKARTRRTGACITQKPNKNNTKIENGAFFLSFENSSPQLAMIMREMYYNVLYYNRSNCGSIHFWHNERRLIDLTWRKRRNKGKVRTKPYTESTENNEKIHCNNGTQWESPAVHELYISRIFHRKNVNLVYTTANYRTRIQIHGSSFLLFGIATADESRVYGGIGT